MTPPARRAHWRAVAIWAVVIFVASSVPGRTVPLPEPSLGLDKLAHAVVYAVLGVLLARAFAGGAPRRATLAVLVAAAYGVSDELHQILTPGRDASVWDWLADVVGAALGVAGRLIYDRARARRPDTSGWEGASKA